MKEKIKYVFAFLSNRLLVLFTVFCIMFYGLIASLFQIQIVDGKEIQESVAQRTTITRTIVAPAPRGEIYDRHGKPLAINTTAYTLKIDTTITVNEKDINDMYLKLIRVLEKNGEDIIDEFPISSTKPYTFLFNDSETRETRWKKDMGIDGDKLDFDAAESYSYLKSYFKIPNDLTIREERLLLVLRSAVFMERYNMNTVTISKGVSDETVTYLEERNQDFPGLFVDIDYLRVYPEGEYVSHILGFTRGISSEELEDNKALGYTSTDLIGKTGIEQSYELSLRGENGKKTIVTDKSGRRLSTETIVTPVQGDKIFLTIDADLTKKVYDILESYLAKIQINKAIKTSKKDEPLTAKDFMISMIESNQISIEKVLECDEDTEPFSQYIKNYFLGTKYKPAEANYELKLRNSLRDAIENEEIAVSRVIGVMHEQGIVTLTDEEKQSIINGSFAPLAFFVEKLESLEITPQMTNIYPSTASVILVDVNSGEIISSVSYPSYDNNQFVNNFNIEYYRKLESDPTKPMYNRALYDQKAPGSTFKMLTAVAGLEESYFTPETKVRDLGTFKDAGEPYARCWIGAGEGSHGEVSIIEALGHSCNYYFYTMSYAFGNAKNNTTNEGIGVLNSYMKLFGLNDPTGVEISEFSSYPDGVDRISGPLFKEHIESKRFEAMGQVAPKSQTKWSDGDTIRTAIGQSYNTYTPAAMAKYVATLANGGYRYPLHYLKTVVTSEGVIVLDNKPEPELVINISEQNHKAIIEGMKMVVGPKGTAKGIFDDFPIPVAAKTGTAQQDTDTFDHASFTCIAPADNPQVAVYVLIPYGNSSTTTAPAAYVAKEILYEYFNLDSEPEKPLMNNTLVQ